MPVVTRGARSVTTLLPPGELIDWRDGTLYDGESSATVIGPTDVADVYDVVGAVSRATGTATFTLADGGTLTAHYDGGAIACTGCTVTRLGPRVQRVQVEATADVSAGGLALQSVGVTRRLRWDVYVID